MYDSTVDTMEHKKNIEHVILEIIVPELIRRAEHHDDSKLMSPEKECYDTYIPQLQMAKYGTAEYYKIKQAMQKEGLDHHYEKNSHHPEHYPKNDISHMNLFDLIEMFADHYAASLRSDTGYPSGETMNAKRYGYEGKLLNIFLNTYDEYLKDERKQ